MTPTTLVTARGQRIAVLFDVPSMYFGCRQSFSSKLDYGRCLTDIIKDRQLVRAIGFATRKADIDNTSFVDCMKRFGIEVVNKILKTRVDPSGVLKETGSINLDLALCAIALAPRVDCIVLATGNGDFVPLAQTLRHMGIRLELVCVERNASPELIHCCDQVTYVVEGSWMFPDEKFRKDSQPVASSPAPSISGLGNTSAGHVNLAGLPQDQ